jgi:acetyl-CoA synthetase
MADTAHDEGAALESDLAELLEVERFEPPATFRAGALLSDASVYEGASADPLGWWSEQARRLDWFKPWE